MLNKQNEIIFKFKSNIDFFLKIKITYFFIIFFSLFFLSWEKISLSITDDENAYINLGFVHSNILIDNNHENFEILNNLKIKLIFQLDIFINNLGKYHFFLRLKIFSRKKIFQITILCLAIILLRLVVNNFGGNTISSPPINWFASFIFDIYLWTF